MKIKDSIKYSFLKTMRNKKNIYFMLVLTICSLTIVGAISYRDVFTKNRENYMQDNIAARSLSIFPNNYYEHYLDKDYDYGYDKVKNIEGVLGIYNMKYDSFGVMANFENSDNNGHLALMYGASFTLPEVVEGRTINENDTGVAICPINFYAKQQNELPKYTEFVDGRSLIGTKFSIKEEIFTSNNYSIVSTGKYYEKEYEIVGVYDNEKNREDVYNCYISVKDMEELYETTNGEANAHSYSSSIVVVDSVENLDKVKKEIDKLEFSSDYLLFINNEAVKELDNMCLAVVIIASIGLILLTTFYVRKENVRNLQQIGLSQALGYSKNDIFVISTLQMLWIIVFSLILSLVIYEIGFYIVCKINNAYILFNNLYISQSIYPILIDILIILIVPILLNILFIRRVTKKNIIKLIRERKS